MSTSSTSINDLADLSLVRIFALLPPDERVRLERVCRKWRKVAQKHAWTEFKTLSLGKKELSRRGDNALAKFRALVDRCAAHLRELSFPALEDYNVEQWAKLRNLRHLHFDHCVGSDTLFAVADKLTHLRSIHFAKIDWSDVAGLHLLLRVDNASLQALRLPMDNPDPLHLPALPSYLRLLHVRKSQIGLLEEQERARIDELLEVAATYCPQLAMLMLPKRFSISEFSLAKLAHFEKLSYLRLRFCLSDVNLFEYSLAKVGAHLKALLLENAADSRVLHLIATHCPLLEHCSFDLNYVEGLVPALQSVFQLANLRSVSIRHLEFNGQLRMELFIAINSKLKAKGNIEYLHLPWDLPLPVGYITSLIQLNPNLRILTCTIRADHTPAEMGKLKTLLHNNMLLEMENNRILVRSLNLLPESISKQFWTQELDSSVPDLDILDD